MASCLCDLPPVPERPVCLTFEVPWSERFEQAKKILVDETSLPVKPEYRPRNVRMTGKDLYVSGGETHFRTAILEVEYGPAVPPDHRQLLSSASAVPCEWLVKTG